MPPVLSGNIAACSEYTQFCSTPMNIETPQSVMAPHPPSTPMDPPSAPIRKPGLARAMTKPSYQRSDLRSWRSSIIAPAYTASVIAHTS